MLRHSKIYLLVLLMSFRISSFNKLYVKHRTFRNIYMSWQYVINNDLLIRFLFLLFLQCQSFFKG